MQTKREKDRIRNILQRIAIFGGVSERALQHILDRAATVAVDEDDLFFRENDRAESMFVLVEGRVAVVKNIGGNEYELCGMEVGDCFGELELIDLRPRAASVRALERCTALEISAAVLREVYQIDEMSFAVIHMNMGREVSRRLRKMDDDLLKVRARDRRRGQCAVCSKAIQADENHWNIWRGGVRHVVCCPVCAEHFRKRPELGRP